MTKRIKLSRVAFSWIVLLTVVLAAGCAGPQPAVRDQRARVERLDRVEVSPSSKKAGEDAAVPGPSVSEKAPIERPGKDGAAKSTDETPPVSPTPEPRKAETPRVSKPEPARTAPGPAAAPKSAAPPEKTGPKIVLNFDNADLYAVIGTIGELLGLNYIVDPNVSGKVTINTAGGLYKKDLFPVFLQILEVNGLTAIKEGSLYRIVQLRDSSRMPIQTRFDDEAEDIPPMDKIIIQIIPLKFIATQEMAKLLTPFISSGGTIVSDIASNTLLVVDKGINVIP